MYSLDMIKILIHVPSKMISNILKIKTQKILSSISIIIPVKPVPGIPFIPCNTTLTSTKALYLSHSPAHSFICHMANKPGISNIPFNIRGLKFNITVPFVNQYTEFITMLLQAFINVLYFNYLPR